VKKEKIMRKIKADTMVTKDEKRAVYDMGFWINYNSYQNMYEVCYSERGIKDVRYTCKTEEEAWEYLYRQKINTSKVVLFDMRQPVKSTFEALYIILWILFLPILLLINFYHPTNYINVITVYFLILSLPLFFVAFRGFDPNNVINSIFEIMSIGFLPIICICKIFDNSMDSELLTSFLKIYFVIYSIIIILKLIYKKK